MSVESIALELKEAESTTPHDQGTSTMHVFARDDAGIRAGIDARIRAVREKDVEGLMAHYTADVATFDMLEPLANIGADAVRKRVTDWFASFATPIDYEVAEVTLAVSLDVAFDHHFTRVRGTTKAGNEVDMWFRETIGYRKVNGAWKVAHQHSSAPLRMPGGTARFDLRP